MNNQNAIPIQVSLQPTLEQQNYSQNSYSSYYPYTTYPLYYGHQTYMDQNNLYYSQQQLSYPIAPLEPAQILPINKPQNSDVSVSIMQPSTNTSATGPTLVIPMAIPTKNNQNKIDQNQNEYDNCCIFC